MCECVCACVCVCSSRRQRGGVIQVRPDTIIGGWGGVAVRFRPNTKSEGPLIVWHRAYSIFKYVIVITGYNFGRGG